MIDINGIKARWDADGRKRDERGRRLFAASKVRAAGHGALTVVSEITGLARSTINRGEDDLDAEAASDGRVRRSGGGRKSLVEIYQTLSDDIRFIVEPATIGDPSWRSQAALGRGLSHGCRKVSIRSSPLSHQRGIPSVPIRCAEF